MGFSRQNTGIVAAYNIKYAIDVIEQSISGKSA